MTIQEFISQMQAIVTVAEEGLATADQFVKGDAEIDVPIELAEAILPVVENLAEKALTAWSTASGKPITVDTVKALLPNATPLTPPPAP